jgi:hypothetical protein
LCTAQYDTGQLASRSGIVMFLTACCDAARDNTFPVQVGTISLQKTGACDLCLRTTQEGIGNLVRYSNIVANPGEVVAAGCY